MDGRQLAHWRMQSLRLAGNPRRTPEEVVGWLIAVQSQDYGPAKWSVGERTVGVTDADLDQALADGTFLRTHVLRPTWHFVLPTDIRWLLELTGPRVQALNAPHYRRLGLDDSVLEKSEALLAGALRGGNQLTRKEVASMLDGAGISATGMPLGYIMMDAELKGLVCSGGLRGKQQTYALLAERAPHTRRLSRDEALAELTLRYFSNRGPATAKDLTWWSSLTLADVRQGLEMVGSQLEHEVIDGVSYWFGTRPTRPEPSPAIHLLQGLDEYVCYGESKYVLDVTGAARIGTGERPMYNNLVVLDGQAAGQWKRTAKRDSVVVEAALYAPFDEAQRRALQVAADRHAEFLGVSTAIVIITDLLVPS